MRPAQSLSASPIERLVTNQGSSCTAAPILPSHAYVANGSRPAWIRLDPQPFAVLTELLTMTAARIPECAANIFLLSRVG